MGTPGSRSFLNGRSAWTRPIHLPSPKYCRVPTGPRKGHVVRLTNEQRQLLAEICEGEAAPGPVAVVGEMGEYLPLIHTVGLEATPPDCVTGNMAEIEVDPWSRWGDGFCYDYLQSSFKPARNRIKASEAAAFRLSAAPRPSLSTNLCQTTYPRSGEVLSRTYCEEEPSANRTQWLRSPTDLVDR